MLKEERRENILKIIDARGSAKVMELSRRFNVSEMTIRRDLLDLYERGLIKRTYGGAMSVNHINEVFEGPLLDRINQHAEEKRAIASAVTRMIHTGETIYISSGSTAYWVAKALEECGELTVVVNSLINARVLAQYPDIVVIVVGGFLRRSELSLIGPFAESNIKNLHVNKVIMGIRGIHPEYGLSSENPQELAIDRAVMKLSENVIAVADHTKFGFVATSLTAPVTAANTIVTSHLASAEIVDAIRRQGVQVIQVKF